MKIDAKKVIVPNWFSKEDLEELLDEKMTDARFREFYKAVEESSFAGSVSEDMVNMWFNFKKFKGLKKEETPVEMCERCGFEFSDHRDLNKFEHVCLNGETR